MTNLPPGLEDKTIEIWVDARGEVYIQKDGDKHTLDKIDSKTKTILKSDFFNNPSARACLDMMGLYTEDEQLKKYLACRYGNFDSIPDFSNNGSAMPDYYNCGNRGLCKFEGKLCDKVRVKNGYITHQEIQIIRLISEDLADKEVANMLGISINTVTTHVQNILKKLEVHGRVGICRFAIEHNL